MRYLTTILLAALSFNAFSQNNAIHVYPWNPDANHNNNIGAEDLLPFLSVFGEEFGLPPEPCTYDGTEFEDLMFGIFDGSIVLDSIFMEYELEDITTYYPVGCPDQVTDTLIFNHNVMLTNFLGQSSQWGINAYDNYGANTLFNFFINSTSGLYWIQLNNIVLANLGFINDGFFGSFNAVSPQDR